MPKLPAASRPICLRAQIKAVEAENRDAALMERAGIAAANLARELLADQGKAVLVLAGPGNNGGDALVAARHLRSAWFKVTVVLAGDAAKLPPGAAQALQAWRAAGGMTVDSLPAARQWDLVIDGLFGSGLQRELSGDYAELVNAINQLGLLTLALDVPSGIDADTGRVLGCALRAAHTLTFIALKPGLLTGDGLDYCGTVHLAPLGIRTPIAASGRTLEAEVLTRNFKPRPRNSHKGSCGSVGVIGGAAGMAGAALLAGRAALKLGAGRVYLGLLDATIPRLDFVQPELMLRSASEIAGFGKLDCLIVGMGLGLSAAALPIVQSALQQKSALVLDADALNWLTQDTGLQTRLHARCAPSVLTPHPGEAARLLGISAQAVQSDRLAAATAIAEKFNSWVVLKGAGSVCATPAGNWWINTSGNPGLAAPGTGDVLSGMIGTFIAQGSSAESATLSAVYLHGAAADHLVANGIGPVGLTASEVIDAARKLLNQANC